MTSPCDPNVDSSSDHSDSTSSTDSGYQSISSGSASVIEAATLGRSYGENPQISAISMRRYPKSPDCTNLKYFKARRGAIAARLKEAVEAHGRNPGYSLSFSLERLGINEQSATLHVVVCCANYLEDVLNNTLASETFQSLLTVPTNGEVLKYVVVPDAPRNLNAKLDLDVISAHAAACGTHCGAPLMIRDHKSGTGRFATLGGIVKATYGNGRVRYFGMTAGHVMCSGQQEDLAAESNRHLPSKENNAVHSDYNDLKNLLGQPLDPRKLPGVSADHPGSAYDWSLVEIRDPQPNQTMHQNQGTGIDVAACTDSYPILVAKHPYSEDSTSDTVLLLSAVGRERRGVLDIVPASIWLAHSEDFGNAYMLELNDGSGKSFKPFTKNQY